MKTDNVIQLKSYAFALRCIKLYRYLCESKKEFVLSKLSIAYKEARETHYWLRLLRDSELLNEKEVISILSDCEELLRIIGSIQKSLKGKPLPNS
jgi:hypothetical protein